MTLITRGVRGRGRKLAASLAVAAVTAGSVALTAVPAAAAAGPHHVLTPSFSALTDSFTPNETVFYPSGFLPIGSHTDEANNKHTSRIYVAFDIGGIYRIRLQNAIMLASESSANDCSKARSLKAQSVAAFTAENTWANPPATSGAETDAIAETTACTTRVKWDLTTALDRAIKRGNSRLWVELQVGAAREDKVAFGRQLYGWEFRFEVTLTNTPPDKPTLLHMGNFETPCSDDFAVNSNTSAFAKMDDRDRNPGDQMTPEFEFWSTADPTVKTPMTWGISSGGDGLTGVGNVPSGSLADGRYAWHARVYDQRAYSEWSDPCYFTVDRTAPAAAPTVSSPEYPENPPNPTGGSAVTGTFLFTANGVADVTAFYYGDAPYSMYTRAPADQLGGAVAIRLRPRDAGEQTLYVASVDKAGNRSPVRAYTFNVRDLSMNVWSVSQTPDPSGAPGMAVEMHFSTQPGNGIVTFVYNVDGGAEHSVTVGADGTVNAIITPLRGGQHLLHFKGVGAGGEILNELETYFYVDDSPQVTSDGVYPIEGIGGGVGVTGVFTVTPQFAAGATHVSFMTTQQNDPVRIPVGEGGVTQISWTPTRAGWTYFWFTLVFEDGSTSSSKSFSVQVAG